MSLLPNPGNLFGDAFGLSAEKNKQNLSGTKTSQVQFDQTAIDKLVYDVLSSDRGLASLASGENLSGGFNSSTKTLQTQDFLTKLIGELAVAGAKKVETEDSVTRQDKKGSKTVICTELARQGLLDAELYEAGGPPSRQVSFITWSGYICWAEKVVTWMQRSPALSLALFPIVHSRYLYLTGAPGKHILGRASVYIGHPICWIIGCVLTLGGKYGRTSEFA
jgi:hypothetical protein